MIKKTLVILIGCLVLLMVFLPALPAGSAPLSFDSIPTPRPTLEPPPKPTVVPTIPGGIRTVGAPGAQIALQVNFADNWIWEGFSWQSLWTVVEWQGPDGLWYEVQGWRGTLDSVEVDRAGGDVTGWRLWWVEKNELGQSPFRWRVYEREGGALLATSSQFSLPVDYYTRVVVEVDLIP